MSSTSLDGGISLRAISNDESPGSRLVRKTVSRRPWKAQGNKQVKNGKLLPDPIPDKISARSPQRGEQVGLAHSVGARDVGGGGRCAGGRFPAGRPQKSVAGPVILLLPRALNIPDDKPLRAGALTKKNDKEQERRLAESRRSEGIGNPSVSLPCHPVRLRAAALPDVVLGR